MLLSVDACAHITVALMPCQLDNNLAVALGVCAGVAPVGAVLMLRALRQSVMSTGFQGVVFSVTEHIRKHARCARTRMHPWHGKSP